MNPSIIAEQAVVLECRWLLDSAAAAETAAYMTDW